MHLNNSDSNCGMASVSFSLTEIMDQYSLLDMYCDKNIKNNTSKAFTYHRISDNEVIASRLDYCLFSVELASKVTDCKILEFNKKLC